MTVLAVNIGELETFKMPSKLDFYDIDSLLSSEEIQVRESMHKFAQNEIQPHINAWANEEYFPKELIPELGRLGVFGSTIEGYDCPGLNYTSYGLMLQEIERVDSGLRSFISVQGALCMFPIYKYANEDLKTKLLPKMAKGELIGCFGLTEADFGSNPSGLLSNVKKDGNSYILNGSKMWITNGCIADLAIVWAKDESGDICGFIIEKDFPGFKTQAIKNKYSLRASVTSELIFENCKIPESHKLNIKGLKGPFSCLNLARFGISWGAIGAAQACFNEALSYSKNRIQFDKAIAGFQLVQNKLVGIFTEVTKAQLLSLQLARLLENNKFIPQQISMAKMNNVRLALDTARTCRDILGANGITSEYNCARHMNNLESVITYEGTEDIHKLILGQFITEIPAFS